MGALEALVFAVAILFFVLRAIFRGLRWLVRAARTAAAPGVEQFGVQASSEKDARPSPAAASAALWPPPPGSDPIRPKAVNEGPAQARRTLRAEVKPNVQSAANSTAETSPSALSIRANRDEILRALVWQEILSPPLSKRQRSASRLKL